MTEKKGGFPVRRCEDFVGKNALQTKEHGDFGALDIAHQGSKKEDLRSLLGPNNLA